MRGTSSIHSDQDLRISSGIQVDELYSVVCTVETDYERWLEAMWWLRRPLHSAELPIPAHAALIGSQHVQALEISTDLSGVCTPLGNAVPR